MQPALRTPLEPVHGHSGGVEFRARLVRASGRDPDWTAAAMNDFSSSRKLELPPGILNTCAPLQRIRQRDTETRAAIAAVHNERDVSSIRTPPWCCAARKRARNPSPVVVLPTPIRRIPGAVSQVIGSPPPEPKRLAGMKDLPKSSKS